LLRAESTRALLLLGTRTNAPGKGIYSCFFDLATAKCTPPKLAADTAMPTAFALSRDRRILYSVSEVGNDGKSDGSLAAWSSDRSAGVLTLLNRVPAGGGGPTTLALDATGRTVLVGSFGNGRTNAFRVLAGGKLGEQTASIQNSGSGPTPRQASPHVHCVVFSPDNRFVLAADFGADKIFLFRFDPAGGTLQPHQPAFAQVPAGSGPRQIVFHPNASFAYLLSELTGSITVFAWTGKDATLHELQTISCFPAETTGDRSGAGLAIHPSGKFLFTTTRTDSSIEVFAIDAASGTLALTQRVDAGGKLPWNCALDPAGRYLVSTNTTANAASIFSIDAARGNLTLLTTVADVPSPVSALFVPI
jgi:6-phosphogluconolactonase